MRRANGYQFLSLILACFGAAAWTNAVDFGTEASHFAAIALMLTAAGSAVMGMQANRRERSRWVQHLRNAAVSLRPGQDATNVRTIDADSFAAAVDGLIAASRAQSLDESTRIRELELQLKAVTVDRDHTQAMLAELAGAVRDAATVGKSAAPEIAQPPAPPAKLSSDRDEHVALAAGLAMEVLRMKRDFISMISHELRTPLASIKAYTEMLLDGEAADGQSQREFYGVIGTEASRLGQAIDNVLSLTRLEAGLTTPVFTTTDLNDVVHDAAEAVQALAESKHLNMQLQLSPRAEAVRGDRAMLTQAVTNLVSNAVKFTPISGRVTVRTAVDADRGKVLLEVEDTGAGIAPKDYAVFFDRSYSSEDEMGRRGGPGSGVGLVLAQQVVEAVHGGRMIVQSSPGKGSCVGFELEAVKQNEPAVQACV